MFFVFLAKKTTPLLDFLKNKQVNIALFSEKVFAPLLYMFQIIKYILIADWGDLNKYKIHQEKSYSIV